MDRISGLPDELLVKILVLVPTKVAVSTSILSKRWKFLWLWLPKLEFRCRCLLDPECERLQSFLDRNLPLHRAPVIESFRLDLCSRCFKPEDIKMWVLTAVCHSLRELDISYSSSPPKPVVLPSNLFTCKSLVILKLEGGFLLVVPRAVSLPSLKTLKLRRVKNFNGETLQRLLSNCPVLEDLVVDLGYTARKLSVIVPSLQNLSLVIPDYHEIDEFVIDTPALKCFKLVDHSRNDYYGLIQNMPCLIEAHVVCYYPDISSLIGLITSVKRLAICSEAMLNEDIVFKFNQLEHLEVCFGQKHLSNKLVRLLKGSPNLQGLNVSSIHCGHVCPQMGYWNQPTTVPECLLSSLQSLSWSEYTGEPQERDIVVYILKHAVHLKTVTIESYESEVPKFEMLKELSLSSRASAACQLIFECASED